MTMQALADTWGDVDAGDGRVRPGEVVPFEQHV
jgi:hypothetical protein